MKFDEALALFPEASPYRGVLTGFVSEDRNRRHAASQAMHAHGLIVPYWAESKAKDEATALAVLRSAVELELPPAADEWEDLRGDLILSILGSVYPSMLGYARTRLEGADDRLRLNLLMLIASAGTRPGIECFVDLVRQHGWPRRMHARFFAELGKNLAHADAMFPALLEKQGYPRIEMGDLVLGALRNGTIGSDRLAGTPLARELERNIEDLLVQRAWSSPTDDENLDDESASELAMLLDLAGFVGGETIRDALHRAASLPEAWPAAFAVTSLLRRKETVADGTIERIASDHAVRATFYSLLGALGESDRIPPHLRSRDAFAAADMVEWLSHGGELGKPPDAIEQMAVLEATRNGEPVVLYVWRFRVDDEPWCASVSGCYPRNPPEGPLQGSETFSRFEAWDSATPEEHANAALKTLEEWGDV